MFKKKDLSNKTTLFYYSINRYLSMHIEKTKSKLKNIESYSNRYLIKRLLTDILNMDKIIRYLDKVNIQGMSNENMSLSDFVNQRAKMIIGKWLSNYFSEEKIASYDVICFSVTYEAQLINSLYFAKLIKEVFPNKKIVFGGNLMTFYQKEIFADKNFWKYMDYCIFYQGENALVDLLNWLNTDTHSRLENVAYISNHKITYIKNIKKFESDFVTPDYSDIHFDLYLSPYRIISLLSSKGCYWSKCRYCSHYVGYGSKFSVNNIKSICVAIEEVKEKWQPDYIYFVDEAMPYFMMKKVADFIIKNNVKIKWFCETRIEKNLVKNENLMHLKEGGCCFLINGIESGSQKTLNEMHKGIIIEDVTEYLKNSFKVGIGTLCMYFVGFPTETQKEARKTFNYIKQVKDIHTLSTIGFFCLERGTDVYKNPQEYGIKSIINKDVLYNTNPEYYLKSSKRISNTFTRRKQLYNLIKDYKILDDKIENFLNRESMIFLFENDGYNKQMEKVEDYMISVNLEDLSIQYKRVKINFSNNTMELIWRK